MNKDFTDNHRITENLNRQINTMVKTAIQTNSEERVKEQIQRTSRAQFTAINQLITDHREISENRLGEIERKDVKLHGESMGLTRNKRGSTTISKQRMTG